MTERLDDSIRDTFDAARTDEVAQENISRVELLNAGRMILRVLAAKTAHLAEQRSRSTYTVLMSPIPATQVMELTNTESLEEAAGKLRQLVELLDEYRNQERAIDAAARENTAYSRGGLGNDAAAEDVAAGVEDG